MEEIGLNADPSPAESSGDSPRTIRLVSPEVQRRYTPKGIYAH
jgi:hypothetical protein